MDFSRSGSDGSVRAGSSKPRAARAQANATASIVLSTQTRQRNLNSTTTHGCYTPWGGRLTSSEPYARRSVTTWHFSLQRAVKSPRPTSPIRTRRSRLKGDTPARDAFTDLPQSSSSFRSSCAGLSSAGDRSRLARGQPRSRDIAEEHWRANAVPNVRKPGENRKKPLFEVGNDFDNERRRHHRWIRGDYYPLCAPKWVIRRKESLRASFLRGSTSRDPEIEWEIESHTRRGRLPMKRIDARPQKVIASVSDPKLPQEIKIGGGCTTTTTEQPSRSTSVLNGVSGH